MYTLVIQPSPAEACRVAFEEEAPMMSLCLDCLGTICTAVSGAGGSWSLMGKIMAMGMTGASQTFFFNIGPETSGKSAAFLEAHPSAPQLRRCPFFNSKGHITQSSSLNHLQHGIWWS